MPGYDIVVVGASLGGLVAVERLLSGLPADFRPPIVLVQHRRADMDSRLTELLQTHTELRIREAEDKEELCASHVYVAPPNYHLLVDEQRCYLSVDPPVFYARPSIDVLFESAAEAFGDRAIGVILTGANEDGANGAVAIKKAGGRVLVQDPDTAESPVCPNAVLARMQPDGVLNIDEIAMRLAKMCRS